MSTAIPLPKTSRPAENALAMIGVTTLDGLTKFTEKEIQALHGMGPKAMRILKEAMQTHRLVFKSE